MPERAVITGTSTGIGAACALRLAAAGWHVYAGVRRESDGCALAERACKGGVTPLVLDVTDAASIARATERVASECGDAGLAGLVNNAGIAVPAPLETIPVAELRHQLEVNVVGQVAVTQAFLPLIRRGRGRIVMMGSVGGLAATPFIGAYCASKFALEALADSLRMELASWGIEVSIIEPGGVATPIWSKGAESFDSMRAQMGEAADSLYAAKMQGMARLSAELARNGIAPDEVARAAYHALVSRSPRTRYVVGRDAKYRKLLQRLPDRLRDRLILRRLSA